jgi:hypothetical protein
MRSCYRLRLSKISYGVLLLLLLTSRAEKALGQTPALDSLRATILSLQTGMAQQDSIIASLSGGFKEVNDRIFSYKSADGDGNPLQQLRLQDALKTSHELADHLEAAEKQRLEAQRQLRAAYAAMGPLIDTEIRNLIRRSGSHKDELALIQKLEQEKAVYAARLRTAPAEEKDWEKIKLAPEDTPQRVKLKTALLEDYRRKLVERRSAAQNELEKRKSERTTYIELQDFYRDLEQSIDDDRELIDSSRPDELRDKIESLADTIKEISNQVENLSLDIDVIKAKIEDFKKAAGEHR